MIRLFDIWSYSALRKDWEPVREGVSKYGKEAFQASLNASLMAAGESIEWVCEDWRLTRVTPFSKGAGSVLIVGYER